MRNCRFCDEDCNVLECAYDAGDCDKANYSSLFQFSAKYSSEVSHYSLRMRDGDTVAAWNVSDAFDKAADVAVEHHGDKDVVR